MSCDPLYQAQLLNEARCDLNIVMGLCVGHDILFQRAAEAPCTTLVVEDRALCHNSVAALHAVGSSSPYNRMMRGTLGWNDEGSNEDGTAGRARVAARLKGDAAEDASSAGDMHVKRKGSHER